MTNERLDIIDRRLDRLVEVTESNTRSIQTLIRISTQHQENFDMVLREMRTMQEEIRGLQTENRRILDHLFGQQGG